MEKYPNWAPLEPMWQMNYWFTLLWVILTIYHIQKLIQLIKVKRESRAKERTRTACLLSWIRRQRP